ncbi:MAG: phytoene desaturase family protein [Vicingaceae bacterium]
MNKKIAVIGSGFSGLSSAAYLAKAGYDVHVFEKNNELGGRARKIEIEGFSFDMGPSWYWMPDVMESFFNDFNSSTKVHFTLKKLSPSFNMVFDKNETISIPKNYNDLKDLFDLIEPGSSIELDKFMYDAKKKYDISFSKLIEKPGLSISEYLDYETIKESMNLSLFSSYQKMVHQKFKNPKLRALMEFPVLFLGAKPKNTPSLYSLMNYAGLKLGTYYPMGGFHSLVQGMINVCKKQGVTFHTNAPITQLNVQHKNITSIEVNNKLIDVDGVIGGADYHHIESKLMAPEYRNYTEKYWEKKTFAPSSLIFYLGINRKIKKLEHHTLFFDADFELHATEIYDDKKWPSKPLFYVCSPSKTDPNVAPKDCENLFILMPLATGIEDNDAIREKYFKLLIKRLEKHLGESISEDIIVKKSYCIKDFKQDYNSFGGNAYGLANTLNQTAIFKPKIINKKIKNLIYTGQLTVPGPGVPPAIISGKISANLLNQTLKQYHYETTI